MQRRLDIDEAHMALDIFRFAIFFSKHSVCQDCDSMRLTTLDHVKTKTNFEHVEAKTHQKVSRPRHRLRVSLFTVAGHNES